MLFNKSQARLICCISIAASILAGCSRNEVKKPALTSAVSSESTADQFAKKKKASRGSQYDTLWDRLFALYALPNIDHPDIDRELSWFANHPAYLERAQNRAEPFLYSIVKLVEKKKIPGELALLPIVESAFQPNVVSSAKAAGIWQFIPSTGVNYGLKRSHSYDGRRDVYASTKAALKYLKKLHGDFGDWLLAIAAYNCGEGAVGRAIRRNEAAGLPTDFWSLNLPQETRAYVPKLLAISRLFADAERYGISLKDLPNIAKYKPVKINNQLDLALAADVAGISLDKLYELNPGFRGQIADVNGSYHLYIPADKKAAEFREEVERLSMARGSYRVPEALADTPPEPGAFQTFRREFAKTTPPPAETRPALGRYPSPASSGDEDTSDSSSRVMARRTADRVMPSRPDYGGRSETAGSRRSTLDSEPYPRDRNAHAGSSQTRGRPPEPPEKLTHYSVQKGETLYSVARKHSVDVAQLAKWNNIPMTTQVQAGQKLALVDNHPEPIRKTAAAAESKAHVKAKHTEDFSVHHKNVVHDAAHSKPQGSGTKKQSGHGHESKKSGSSHR